MTRIAMESQGKRPRFFPESGADETVSMLLELMSELWVVRERLYALEQVAAEHGLELTQGIEAWQPDQEQAAALDAERARFIKTVLRSLDADHAPGLHLRRALDEAARQNDDGTLLTDAARAA
jgi:hypothetical protein